MALCGPIGDSRLSGIGLGNEAAQGRERIHAQDREEGRIGHRPAQGQDERAGTQGNQDAVGKAGADEVRARRKELEPETRVGHCCGCGEDDALYKIPGIPRWRCDACFVREVGYHHHLSLPRAAKRTKCPHCGAARPPEAWKCWQCGWTFARESSDNQFFGA